METDSSKIVRGYKSTSKRHGTLNLFAALQVGTGRVHTAIPERKRREEFLRFMDTEHQLVFLTFYFCLFASQPWTAVVTKPRAISGFDAKWACI